MLWGTSSSQTVRKDNKKRWEDETAALTEVRSEAKVPAAEPVVSLAFYRKHTENMLRRYLYASMQVGRAPSILGEPIARGWVSSRPVHTFEDAVIFVLDVETCLNQLGSLDRQLLCRIVIQEYTQAEAATLLGMSVRAICYKFPQALDRLTEKLLATGLLVLPQ
jgi:DNA-directed RNA polymerase specialized sigma24 family protein